MVAHARPPKRRRALGPLAERAAAWLLRLKGYRIRHRNWRAGRLELDLVAERGAMLVFVEVKARSSGVYGGAAAALDAAKQRRLVRAAAAYLTRFSLWDRPCRFDAVLIERVGGRLPWRLRHMADAFRPDLGRTM